MDAVPPTLEPVRKPEHVRELTVRALIASALVALLIGAAYPYIVMKLGFGPNISVVSAFFGFLMLGLVSRSFNRWENNMVQTAGTTAGMIAFLAWLLAAFELLARDPSSGFSVRLTMWDTFLWFSTAGILGVLLAVPLRRYYIEEEKLTFADGVAAAETLVLLDSRGPEARRSAMAMVSGLVLSAAFKWSHVKHWMTDAIPIALNRFSERLGVGFSLELLTLGSGMIIGLRICTSMILGLLLSWVIAPVVLATPGLLDDQPVIGETARKTEVLLWVMWPATGMLVAAGLTALALKWGTLVRSFQALGGASVESRDFPLKWVVIGSLAATGALVWIQYDILGTPVWQSLLAIVLSIPLMLVAMRVLGETNWGPISTMTNVMQAMFGAIRPGDMHATVVSSGITGTVAAQSEGLMQDYKAGHIVGSTPRLLTIVQLLAVPIGTLALAWMYPLLVETYGLGEEGQLQTPLSIRWVGFAKILGDGFGSIHFTAVNALFVGAVLGIVLTLLEQKQSWKRFVPSPSGVGIGMLVPASAVATMFLGAVVDFAWRKVDPRSATSYSIPVATGLIAGEALVAVIVPLLVTLGLMAL